MRNNCTQELKIEKITRVNTSEQFRRAWVQKIVVARVFSIASVIYEKELG